MNILNHTLIIATKDNDEAMAKFYIDILGFEKNDFGGYVCGNLAVYFDRHSGASLRAKEPFRVMLTLEVPNINDAYKELKEKGVEFVRQPESEEWGGKFATFVDPDGNYLQLFEMPKS